MHGPILDGTDLNDGIPADRFDDPHRLPHRHVALSKGARREGEREGATQPVVAPRPSRPEMSTKPGLDFSLRSHVRRQDLLEPTSRCAGVAAERMIVGRLPECTDLGVTPNTDGVVDRPATRVEELRQLARFPDEGLQSGGVPTRSRLPALVCLERADRVGQLCSLRVSRGLVRVQAHGLTAAAEPLTGAGACGRT